MTSCTASGSFQNPADRLEARSDNRGLRLRRFELRLNRAEVGLGFLLLHIRKTERPHLMAKRLDELEDRSRIELKGR